LVYFFKTYKNVILQFITLTITIWITIVNLFLAYNLWLIIIEKILPLESLYETYFKEIEVLLNSYYKKESFFKNTELIENFCSNLNKSNQINGSKIFISNSKITNLKTNNVFIEDIIKEVNAVNNS